MLTNIVSLKRIVFQIGELLDARQKRQAFFVCVSMILTSFLELVGVSMIYPFLNLMLDVKKAKGAWYVKWIYAFQPDISVEYVLFVFGIGIILAFLIKNIASLFFSYLQYRFASEFQCEASTLMLSSYMKRPYEFFVMNNSGDILRGINEDTISVYNELLALFQILGEMITISLLGIYLFITSWMIAVGALILSAICFFLITVGFKEKIKKAGRDNRETVAKKNQYSLQAVNGIKEITVLDRRDIFVKQYYNASIEYANTSMTYNFIVACPDRILEGVCISGFIGIVCFRIVIGIDITTFIPVLGAFVMGAFKILPSISKLSSRITTIVFHQPGLQSCYDNFMEARRIDNEQKNVRERKSIELVDVRFIDKLSLYGITWQYADSEKSVLKNLSLTINKGESVAFIGASGAGKTTLADVVLGLLKPKAGTVEMDGIDVYSIQHEWSRIIGYVPQAVYLIDDTIRANVAFGIESEEVDDNKIWDALNQAQLKDFVESLPDGIDTIVGERGIKFSGGQRQRVAIARALYDNPDILVLDEATSALDTETETAVMESIEALHGHKTLIIVAHRLSTIRKCDRIYEIVDGKAVERKHEEVFEK